MDSLSPEARSALMARVGRKDTEPELAVRCFLHSTGLRYRLPVASLPGTPDIVLPRYRSVVFVHGCFWHRHNGCPHTRTPKSNVAFWESKFARNVQRDQRTSRKLRALGWRVFVVWGCDISPRRL